jgi:hypothetical protein
LRADGSTNRYSVQKYSNTTEIQMKCINRLLSLVVATACVVALAHVGAAFAQDKNSGFLRDYTRLQAGKDSKGQEIRSWVSPKLTPANYNAIMVDPIIFYPEPQPSQQVSAAELQKMLAYANDALKQSLGNRFNMVDHAGPGVVRISVAFTSVAAKEEGLKPYQLVPLAFVATMAKRSSEGGAPQRAFIVVESQATDSTTGDLLGSRVKVGTGEGLAKTAEAKVITLEVVKPILDELAQNAFTELPKYVKGK